MTTMAARKAALALHALAADDRSWLIERLSGGQRDVVVPMLEELAELGIPADRRLIDEALRSAPSHGGKTPHQAVDALTPVQAALVLRGEPTEFIACVLRLADWPWTPAFIETLDASSKRRLAYAMHEAPALGGQALRDWLMGELARRAMNATERRELPPQLAWSVNDGAST